MAKEEQKALTSTDAQEYVPAAAAFVKNINECLKNDDVEKMVSIRNSNPDTIRALKEFQARAEFAAKQVKEFLVRVCTPFEETLPAGIKWNKQSYTYEFTAEGAGAYIANELIAGNLVTADQIFNILTPSNICKAAGLTVEKLHDMYRDTIAAKEKARVLSIK